MNGAEVDTDRSARRAGDLTVVGSRALTKNISAWLSGSVFTDLPSATEI